MKTIKTITILALVLAARFAPAQGYALSTNLWFTNTIAASATLTYTGTNMLDLTRFRSFAITATGAGTNYSTNTLTFTFKSSPTGSNWGVAPDYTLSGTIYGTNPYVLTTNLDATGIGYLKPYQIINSATNAITNAWTYGELKTFPRN